MEVKADRVKVWRKDIEGRNGTFYRYSVSVSRKMEDGKYENAYIPVVFSKKSNAPEKISNGAVCSIEGFMSVDSYTDKDNNKRNTPQIVVMKAEFEDASEGSDDFEQAEDDIPF